MIRQAFGEETMSGTRMCTFLLSCCLSTLLFFFLLTFLSNSFWPPFHFISSFSLTLFSIQLILPYLFPPMFSQIIINCGATRVQARSRSPVMLRFDDPCYWCREQSLAWVWLPARIDMQQNARFPYQRSWNTVPISPTFNIYEGLHLQSLTRKFIELTVHLNSTQSLGLCVCF
jgi:hypothetical protein